MWNQQVAGTLRRKVSNMSLSATRLRKKIMAAVADFAGALADDATLVAIAVE